MDIKQHHGHPAAPSSEIRSVWSAEELQQATQGEWIVPPPPGWFASGISIYAPSLQPGHAAMIRSDADDCGIPPKSLALSAVTPSCLIATDLNNLPASDLPVLQVAALSPALLALGGYHRDHLQGKVIGITGSAGKTTCVAMVAEALSPFGETCKSAFNANLPRGVAWNLASMPRDAAHLVLEMAIGRMHISSRMARPDIAIFTNVLPAHLGEKSTVQDIARTKSYIFSGMSADGVAILNRDMMEWDIVVTTAQEKQLKIVTYGEHESCNIRLIGYDAAARRVTASLDGEIIEYQLAVDGKHMALNSLAALATVKTLGYPLAPALEKLSAFNALAGRGEMTDVRFNDLDITLIDDAYNANPGSMKAAVERLSGQRVQGRRIAILSEMADLGLEAEKYHTDLSALLNDSAIDRIYLIGDQYQQCWNLLSPQLRGALFTNADELKPVLFDELQNGDTVMFKGSHSTNLHKLVAWFSRAPVDARVTPPPQPAAENR